jgi:D-alanine transaminase
MDALANIDGVIMPLSEAKISALDRGFLFGDAVYEVLRVYGGKPWLAVEHFQRLARSLEAVRIRGVNLERLRERMTAAIAAGPFREALAYIQITRGAAPRKHTFPGGAIPLEFMYVQEFIDPYVDARATGVAVITQPDPRWHRCDIKSTNLLGNVLAMQAAAESGAVEALLYLPDGTMTEGTHTSFFGVMDEAVLTPPNSPAILPGITRSLVLRLAERAGLPVREQTLMHADLRRVTEIFLTGTTAEILPVVRIEGRSVGTGKPGPVTCRLQEAYAGLVREFTRV